MIGWVECMNQLGATSVSSTYTITHTLSHTSHYHTITSHYHCWLSLGVLSTYHGWTSDGNRYHPSTLSHYHHHTITLSSSHYHTIIITLSSSHYHALILTLSHYHPHTITLSSSQCVGDTAQSLTAEDTTSHHSHGNIPDHTHCHSHHTVRGD